MIEAKIIADSVSAAGKRAPQGWQQFRELFEEPR